MLVRLWPLYHRVYPCASWWSSDRPTRSRFPMVYLGSKPSAVLHSSCEAPLLLATCIHNTWSPASLLPYVITELRLITQRGNLTLRYECLSVCRMCRLIRHLYYLTNIVCLFRACGANIANIAHCRSLPRVTEWLPWVGNGSCQNKGSVYAHEMYISWDTCL
jgi:hypothetical protein